MGQDEGRPDAFASADTGGRSALERTHFALALDSNEAEKNAGSGPRARPAHGAPPMRIEVVGGGPAGLWFAFLIKRRRPAWAVRVHEQNPAGATYGFGVVLSDAGRQRVRSAAPAAFDRIARRMERWEDLTIVHRDEAVRIDGNGFSAIGRLDLLRALHALCAEAGVVLQFDAPAGPGTASGPGSRPGPESGAGRNPGSGSEGNVRPQPEAGSGMGPESGSVSLAGLRADADLVVGADGIHSGVRAALESCFRPRTSLLDNRFAWYGTRQRFDTLTLTFRANPDGAFVAHHYRYRPAMSTFIVECGAAAWERSGLEALDDGAARRYCETVFAADLEGHPLISNRSVWRRFPVTACERWSHENVVLIGDALRSVHFSIGSGTRLAMEDADALADALDESGGRVREGLERFEAERRPVVEQLLAGAAGSWSWYERFPERMHLGAPEFAHDYMTRSGRVSDDRLRAIAPAFMERLSAGRRASGEGER